ncbi:hypothetical protein EVAR_23295_1 [Eumeta japonica]|uniref:Uncharacterized protein n=1 Tax=Eumeta variegata TaxID=151549 RepID=A0A4C1V553_EUMVA|nr:hypothetical protein EVAR_23295_1 [Eumeta japonica]
MPLCFSSYSVNKRAASSAQANFAYTHRLVGVDSAIRVGTCYLDVPQAGERVGAGASSKFKLRVTALARTSRNVRPARAPLELWQDAAATTP